MQHFLTIAQAIKGLELLKSRFGEESLIHCDEEADLTMKSKDGIFGYIDFQNKIAVISGEGTCEL